MKFYKKILFVLLMLGFVSGCRNLDLNLQDNPNAISPDQGDLESLYNAIQLQFAQVYGSAELVPGAVSRMYHAQGGYTYRGYTTPNTFNGLWSIAYEGLLPDIDALITISEGQGLDIHVGSALILQAYTMMVLVDIFGDVPYTEAGAGTGVISPEPDDGGEIYAQSIALLDEAIAMLTGTTASAPNEDNFYDGDADKWITVANTIKLRAGINMGNSQIIADALAGNDIIDADDGSEDFQFQWSANRSNPDSRHPFYANHYETGDGRYNSNYYMWLLKANKQDGSGADIVDPRIRYYFYRKIEDSGDQDANSYGCHYSRTPDQSAKPAHWDPVDPRLPYCIASLDGYTGRDHLSAEGIPPDGPIRTSYGLYPFGGLFDDDTFEDTRESGTLGGLGAGIYPILIASTVDLMLAEAVLNLGAAGNARALLEAGIYASLDKVESFEDLVSKQMTDPVELRDGTITTVKALYGMSDDSKLDYVTEVLAMYDAATPAGQLAIIVKENYIASWGNGLEAYNMYRRTGYPDKIEPGLEPTSGQFPLSFWYPSDNVTRNSNMDQKADLGVPVFWQNPAVTPALY